MMLVILAAAFGVVAALHRDAMLGAAAQADPARPEDDAAYLEVEEQRAHLQGAKKVKSAEFPMEPHMEDIERALFYKLLDNATHYQEFGSGGSTVVALKRANIKKIHTVESDRQWIEDLTGRQDVSSAMKVGRMKFVYADIGPTGLWGHPTDYSHQAQWPGYSGEAAERDDGVHFDLVFVDGRFRVACLLKALRRDLTAKRTGTVFTMHDYMNRAAYHVVEKFVRVVDSAGTLAVFEAMSHVDQAALDAEIATHENKTSLAEMVQ